MKRLIRESYRLNEEKINTGNSIIFLAKKSVDIDKITFKDIESDMINIMKMVG